MIEYSADILSGGQSQKVALSTTSAQSTAITAPSGHPAGTPVPVLVLCDVPAFVRRGSNPAALNDGTDQILAAGTHYRVSVMSGEKLAFILASGTGNAYITPGA